jgi:phage-related baseplate assembly protein
VTLAQAAVDAWAVPLTVTATVAAATGVSQAVTATVTGTDLPAAEALDTLAEATLGALFAAVPIGGVLARSAILSALQVAIEGAGASRVAIALTEPAADLSLDVNEVVTLGAVSVTRA